MKTKSTLIILLTVLMFTVVSGELSAQKKSKKAVKRSGKAKSENIMLFNGKDLANWAFFLKDPNVDPSTVFTVREGIIHISGDPFGYMRTKDSYSEYKLHVEWRYPVEATNSGVFVHTQLPDAIWPRCFECQLQAGNAGDFVCMGGAEMKEQADKTKRVVKKLAGSNEKPVGEWNSMEVTCKSNTIDVVVNGVLQNKGTGISVTEGHICLQSEGKDIEFRNVFLTKLKK
jgi:hypothetical protein